MKPSQVFIVGMNGSGTTMLLDCLAGHSQLFGFRGETKVLPYFIRRQPRYGDLTNDRNFRRLWSDLENSVSGQGWRKGQTALSIEEWGQRPRSAAAIFDRVMGTLAAAEGKHIWCEKTPMYVHHMDVLADAFPAARFIHVIRDGRDCAASFHRRWKFNPLRTGYRWKSAVRAGKTSGARLGNRYVEVRYEQLTKSPEQSLRVLCRFLNLQFEPQILKPARSRPQMTGSAASSIIPNERKSDEYFTPFTLRRIEAIAGRQLEDCGYAPHYIAGDDDPQAWQLKVWEFLDDFRRVQQAILTAGAKRRSKRLSFVSRRVLGALKQKSSLK